MNFNKVLLVGRLTRDPEIRKVPSGTDVAEVGLAVSRSYKTANGDRRDDTTFVDIIAWDKRAEIMREYYHKGDEIYVEGRLELDRWESDGQKRSKLRVVADSVHKLKAKGGGTRDDNDTRGCSKASGCDCS